MNKLETATASARCTIPTDEQLQVLSEFLPMLAAKIEDEGGKFTTDGITLKPTWRGWVLRASYELDGEEVVDSYYYADARPFVRAD